MLVLSRQVDETLIVRTTDGLVKITVVDIRGDKVRIGIDAPRNVRVDREEIDTIRQAQKPAAPKDPRHMTDAEIVAGLSEILADEDLCTRLASHGIAIEAALDRLKAKHLSPI